MPFNENRIGYFVLFHNKVTVPSQKVSA